jgi:hypothetical protein
VPLLINDASRISTVTLTLVFDPTKLRVRSVRREASCAPAAFRSSSLRP